MSLEILDVKKCISSVVSLCDLNMDGANKFFIHHLRIKVVLEWFLDPVQKL